MSSTRCGRKPSEHSVVNPRISCMPPPGLCGMSLSPTPTLVMAMSASIESDSDADGFETEATNTKKGSEE